MHTHTLRGVTLDQLRAPASLLLEGARLAIGFYLGFSLEGASARKGPCPSWPDAACALTMIGLTVGSAAVTVGAPTQREADPTRFGDPREERLGALEGIG